ncbi:MAG: Nif3-like dinuclear metal center hexameric protein [Ruthenibacterium sp.]
MPNITQVAEFLETWAPKALAEPWDNVGILVRCEEKVTGILTALDITPAVVAEAVAHKCNLIVSHHPVIFTPLTQLTADSAAFALVQNHVSAICMHTNLDAAPGGVNDMLVALFSVQNAAALSGCGRIGTLRQNMTVPQFCALTGKVLQTHGTYYDSGKPIHTLAIVSGAGGDFMAAAQEAGADCLLTGEVKYHEALCAKEAGFSFVSAGHFETEFPIADLLRRRLAVAFPKCKIYCTQENESPFTQF